MKKVVTELHEIIRNFSAKVNAISDADFSAKPLPNKWSRKEIVGHLIDSAQNNLRRFICGQYEPSPPKITYDQDYWVRSNDYQQMSKDDIIQLWSLINLRIVTVLETMPLESYWKEVETSELHTLEWLAHDYVKHLKHHLNQIFPKTFDVVYP